MNLHAQMLKTQEWGGPGVVPAYVKQHTKQATWGLPSGGRGAIPFGYSLSWEPGDHERAFGRRIIEDPVNAHEMESRVYISEAGMAHMQALQDRASLDYVKYIERYVDMPGLHQLSLMDIGGGTGDQLLKIARLLQSRHQSLTVKCSLLDNSRDMITSSRETFKDFTGEKNFHLYDITAPVKRDYEVDVVMSHTTLHHFELPKEALINMYDYARRLLIVWDLSRPPLAFFEEVLAEQGKHYRGEMKDLFENSLMSSLSYPEFCALAKDLDAVVDTIDPMYQILLKRK